MTDNHAFLSERELKTLLRRQQNLIELCLRDTDFSQLCPHLSGIIDTPFAVVNFSGRLVFNNTDLEDWAVLQKWPWRDRPQFVTVDQTQLQRYSLVHQGNRVGNILFKADAQSIASEGALLMQAAKMVARSLYDATDQSPFDPDACTIDELIALHFDDRLSVDSLIEHCASRGVALVEGDYQCVLLLGHDIADPGLSAAQRDQLRIQLNDFLQMPPNRGQWFSVHGAALLILPVPPRMRPASAKGVMEKWRMALEGPDGHSVLIAISDRKESVQELRDAYLEARAVARVIIGLGEAASVASYRDFELFFLFDDLPRERMLRFSRGVFRGLPDKPEGKDGKLMASLEAFIDNECNMAIAARVMGVHKNTLSYRLDRVSELIGIDLRHSDEVLRLKLAFIMRKIVRRTELAVGRKSHAS